MIYKMRMGDPIEINLVPLGFSFKELSTQTKNYKSKMMSVVSEKSNERISRYFRTDGQTNGRARAKFKFLMN